MLQRVSYVMSRHILMMRMLISRRFLHYAVSLLRHTLDMPLLLRAMICLLRRQRCRHDA